MTFTDPTYLRTIHDGLLSGVLHKDNASALPMSIVGMYEEALPPANNVNERKKFLDFFAVWAMLKKEVSVAFLMPLLEGWSEEIIIYYLNTYSKWFNSPQNGKYVLYHERLRAFILQKISKQQFNACNETIIKVSNDALSRRSGDELERYALEYLSNHMLIPAIEKGDASALKLLTYNTTHWNRQVEISKGFEWSKRMLNNMMLWASKYDDEEVIECALNKVDLHYQEQNDAPRIVELVAQNDIETALQRIEAFGGNDKEGLERKFILYMLCLMELTLLDSKDKPFRKEAIEKLLKHFDDNIPANQPDLINWNDFFPSYLMFQMACEWAEMGLDYMITYKTTDEIEMIWIEDFVPYSDIQLSVLSNIWRHLFEGSRNSISSFTSEKCKALIFISTILNSKGEIKDSEKLLNKAPIYIRKISNKSEICELLCILSSVFVKKGNVEGSELAMEEALNCALTISDELDQSYALRELSTQLAKQGKVDEALKLTNQILDEFVKIMSFAKISTIFVKQGWIDKGEALMLDALQKARKLSFEYGKTFVLSDISTELAKQKKFTEADNVIQEAIFSANKITSGYLKSYAFRDISFDLANQGKIEKALTFVNHIEDEPAKGYVQKAISIELAKQGMIENSLSIAKGILDENNMSSAIRDISAEFAKQGNIIEAGKTMKEILTISGGISSDMLIKKKVLGGISLELVRHGKNEDALACVYSFSSESERETALLDVLIELTIQGKIEDAMAYALGISEEFRTSGALLAISIELVKQKMFDASETIFQKALNSTQGILSEFDKSIALKNIARELNKNGEISRAEKLIKESLISVHGILDDSSKSIALGQLSIVLAEMGNIDESLKYLRLIKEDFVKNYILNDISVVLAKQGNIEQALLIIKEISEENEQSKSLFAISSELAKIGKIEDAFNCARKISDESVERSALCDISAELAKQGKTEDALIIAGRILEESKKNTALFNISLALCDQGNIARAEEVGLGILLTNERCKCWQRMGESELKLKGFFNATESIKLFNYTEARLYFKRGLINALGVVKANSKTAIYALKDSAQEISSIEHVLKMYALNQFFFEEITDEKIKRYNRTLNIQWAMDIKNNQYDKI